MSYYSPKTTRPDGKNDNNDIKVLSDNFDSYFQREKDTHDYYYKNSDFNPKLSEDLVQTETISSLRKKMQSEIRTSCLRFPPNTDENNRELVNLLHKNSVQVGFKHSKDASLDFAKELTKLGDKTQNNSLKTAFFHILDIDIFNNFLLDNNYFISYGGKQIRFQDLFEIMFGLNFKSDMAKQYDFGKYSLENELTSTKEFTFYDIFRGQTSDFEQCKDLEQIFKNAKLNSQSENPLEYFPRKLLNFIKSINQIKPKPGFNKTALEKVFSLEEYFPLIIYKKEDYYIISRYLSQTKEGQINTHLQQLIGMKQCNYATFATEITFRQMPANPKFVLVSTDSSIELSIEENDTGEIEVEANPVVSYTYVGHPEGSKKANDITANIINQAENRYYALGYRKIKYEINGGLNEYYIHYQDENGKKQKYIKVTFWMKLKKSGFEKTIKELEEMEPKTYKQGENRAPQDNNLLANNQIRRATRLGINNKPNQNKNPQPNQMPQLNRNQPNQMPQLNRNQPNQMPQLNRNQPNQMPQLNRNQMPKMPQLNRNQMPKMPKFNNLSSSKLLNNKHNAYLANKPPNQNNQPRTQSSTAANKPNASKQLPKHGNNRQLPAQGAQYNPINQRFRNYLTEY